MTHWIIAPVVIPALLAPIMALAMRHDFVLQRIFSIAATVAMLMVAVGLGIHSLSGDIWVYELGNWPAPFGIVLVLDRLSALMLLLTSVLALGVVLYSAGSGWDRRGWHFHPLFQFQLMGVNGAFLTGDAFNLFVFFEVLLIASYGLMIHGGGKVRLRAGLQYVVMNLAGSTLFLFALGTLYAVTGTLNMADMAVKAREIAPGDEALLLVGAALLLIVFAIKAALFPMQFWLPGTYANAPAPVAALFAIMTKVGAYAILRMYTLIFGPDLSAVGQLFVDLVLPAALITILVGSIGVLGARRLPRLLAFSVLASMGTLLVSMSLNTEQGTTAALYYMVHSTFAAAVLFLISDLTAVAAHRNKGAPGGLIAAMFFAGAIAMAGMPPLSGFLGKLLILDAARSSPYAGVIWAVILGGSLLVIIGFARIGTFVFWKAAVPEEFDEEERETPALPQPTRTQPLPHHEPSFALAASATMGFLVLLGLLSVGAGPVTAVLQDTAQQLLDTSSYINAVLPPVGGS